MSRYIVIGAGAVGASLAAQFEASGVAYALVGRGAQIRHIREKGLTYQRPHETKTVRLNAYDSDEPPVLQIGDVLILTVKAQDVDAATAFWARQPVEGSSDTAGALLPIVTLQNGLAAEAIAARRFARVYAASLLTPARFTEVGTVVAGGSPQVGVLTIGVWPEGLDPSVKLIAEDLVRSGYLAEAREDVLRWKAAKLVYNVKNVIELFVGDEASIRDFEQQLSAEAKTVLAAAGHTFADPSERRISLDGWGLAPDSGIRQGQQSTWQSFSRGASSEVDFLNGEIVLLGRVHHVPTPYNTAIQKAASRLAESRAQPGTETIPAV